MNRWTTPIHFMPRSAPVNRPRPAVTRVSAERMGQLRVEAAARGQSASEAIRAAEASSARSHTRTEEWHERLVRQARESRAGLQAWFGNQWMESGAASAVEQSQIRGHIRHTFRRLRQDAWDALEQRLDPQPVQQRGGQRGGGYYEAPGEGTINQVWEAFFNQMMTSMDSALCDGWIVQDDLSEPFIQLGMPALAIVEIALQSRDNLGVTVSEGLVITQDQLDLGAFEEARELFVEVEGLKLALVQSKVETHEEVEFLRKSSLYAGAKDLENCIPLDRRNELNGIVARAQRTAIKMTQKAFYKNASEELITELERREALT